MKPRLLCHCSFVPVRLLQSLGFETVSLADALVGAAPPMGELVSPAICSCMRALGRVDWSRFDGVILSNCCASAERLYDALRCRHPELFVALLETPAEISPPTLRWMRTRLERLLVTLHNRFGLPVPGRLEDAASDILSAGFPLGFEDGDHRLEADPPACSALGRHPGTKMENKAVWLIGSGIHPSWLDSLEAIFHGMRLWVSSCFSRQRGDELVAAIAGSAGQVEPCPRMSDFIPWFERALHGRMGEIGGVVGMAAQKCDFGLFALPSIRSVCERAGVPVLLLEEEFSPDTLERSRIRLEAFYENIAGVGSVWSAPACPSGGEERI